METSRPRAPSGRTPATPFAPCRANWEALAPFADAGVYVNNLGSEDRAREAYGEEKYRRLVALKDSVDAENVFHLNANIVPSPTT